MLTNQKNYSLKVSEYETQENWNHLNNLIPHKSFYLSYAFAMICKTEGLKPLYFQLLDHDRNNIGIALGFLSDQWRRWPLNQVFQCFLLRTLPAVKNNDIKTLEIFSAEIMEYVEKLGVRKIHFNSEDAPISSKNIGPFSMIEQGRLEFLTNLDLTDDEIMSNMKSRRRSYLRKLIKESSVSVQEENNLQGIFKLIEFQGSSRERRRERGEDYQISAQSAGKKILQNYVNPGYARIFTAYIDQQPVSSIMLHCYEKHAYYTMAGSSENGFKSNAPTFLIWEVMRTLRDDGYQTLNMGGVTSAAKEPNNKATGLYQFKKSFGGKEIMCVSWYKETGGIRSKLADFLENVI